MVLITMSKEKAAYRHFSVVIVFNVVIVLLISQKLF
jgi:hypothetical protein